MEGAGPLGYVIEGFLSHLKAENKSAQSDGRVRSSTAIQEHWWKTVCLNTLSTLTDSVIVRCLTMFLPKTNTK